MQALQHEPLLAMTKKQRGMIGQTRSQESMRAQMRLNRTRHDRVFEPGEIVFRRLPAGTRLPKHLFPEPSSGPYEVVDQPTASSLVLRHPDGDLVDKGLRVPLDQILAGPPRAKVVSEETSEVCGLGTMLKEENAFAGRAPSRAGAASGKRKG